MYKKVLLFVMSCLLFIGTQTLVWASEISNQYEFKVGEVVQENNFASKAEAIKALSMLQEGYTGFSFSPSEEHISIKVFLENFTGLRKYCSIVNDNLVYPMGDSMWLSAEEWSELMENLYRPISLNTMNKIIERTLICDEFLKNHSIPVSYSDYKAEIEAFYGEYIGLLKKNVSAASFWIRKMNEKTIYELDKFASLMHEVSHEQSAKNAGIFQNRFVTENTWGVRWGTIPNCIYPYNSKTGESWEIKLLSLPKTLDLVRKDDIPDGVQKTIYYKVYFAEDSMSNLIGVYGMLEELCASSIDVRMMVIGTSLKKVYCFQEDFLQAIYFWKGAIGEYLIRLKATNPNVYKQLIATECNPDDGVTNFSEILKDTLEFINEQKQFVNIIPSGSEDVVALRDWSASPEIQEILAEVISN